MQSLTCLCLPIQEGEERQPPDVITQTTVTHNDTNSVIIREVISDRGGEETGEGREAQCCPRRLYPDLFLLSAGSVSLTCSFCVLFVPADFPSSPPRPPPPAASPYQLPIQQGTSLAKNCIGRNCYLLTVDDIFSNC